MSADPDPTLISFCETIAETFTRLGGRPRLLSPADWDLARHWHCQGIPLDLVRQTLEEVCARRSQRGQRGVISSLRYFAAAVEVAWSVRSQKS